MFFYETRYFALPTSECPFPAKRRGSLNIFRKKAGQSRADSQLEEYNRKRVVHQPHLKSRPEKDLGLKGWGGEGRGGGGVENWKIVRTSGKILATPLVQELSHG